MEELIAPADEIAAEETQGTPIPPSAFERMRGMKRFEGRDYADESAALEDALSSIDELEASTSESQAFKDALAELLNGNPQIAFLLEDVKKTGNFHASLMSMFDNPEDLLLKEGDEGYDAVQERVNSRIDGERTNAELRSRIEANQERFPAVLDAFIAKKGATEEEADAFMTESSQLAENIIMGDVTEEDLEKLWKMHKYDADIADVDEDLSIAALNTETEGTPTEEEFSVPQGITPAIAPSAPQRAMNPLEEVIQANKMN